MVGVAEIRPRRGGVGGEMRATTIWSVSPIVLWRFPYALVAIIAGTLVFFLGITIGSWGTPAVGTHPIVCQRSYFAADQ